MIYTNDTVISALPNLDGYSAPQSGTFYGSVEEVAWYATDDDRVLLGIVTRRFLDENDEGGPPPGVYYAAEVLTRKPEWEVADADTDSLYDSRRTPPGRRLSRGRVRRHPKPLVPLPRGGDH